MKDYPVDIFPDFNNAGFLSPEIESYKATHRQMYKDLFLLVSDINIYAHQFMHKCEIKSRDYQAIIGICLFFRILNSFASATILAERGLGHDAEAITRVALEATFYLKRVADDEKFAIDFIKSDQRTRLTLLNVAKDRKSGLYDLFEQDAQRLQEIYLELDKYVKDESILEIKAFQVDLRPNLVPVRMFA